MEPRLDLPCIAFHHDDRSTLLFSISEHECIAHDVTDEVLQNKIVCPTAQGPLLVRDPDTLSTFLWNPLSDDKVELPRLQGVDDAVLIDSHCLLSDKITAPGCIVILVEAWQDNTTIWYCRPGGDHWKKYNYDIGYRVLPYPDGEDDQIQKDVICSIAARGGKFYFDHENDRGVTELFVIDFGSNPDPEPPTLTAVPVDDTATAGGDNYGRVFLVESGGDLYRVRLLFRLPYEGGDEIDRCSVHRMDFSTLRWCDVRDLGGRAFLLSQYYFGASCSAAAGEHGLLPDRVYFLFDRNSTLQVFDVQDGSNKLQKLDVAPEMVDKAFWLLPINH